jgi:hypothetical protein
MKKISVDFHALNSSAHTITMSSAQDPNSNRQSRYYELEGSVPEAVTLPQYEALAELEATTAGRGIDRLDSKENLTADTTK